MKILKNDLEQFLKEIIVGSVHENKNLIYIHSYKKILL